MNNSFWHSTNHVTSRHVINRQTNTVTSRHVINRQTNTVTSRDQSTADNVDNVSFTQSGWTSWRVCGHTGQTTHVLSVRLDVVSQDWTWSVSAGRGQSRLDARLVCCCRWWGWWRCNGRIDGFHSVELGTNCDVETIVWLTTQQQQAYVLYIIRRHRHQNTQTDRQTNGRTGRQTDGQTHRQTDWQTDRNEIKAQLVEYLLSETVVSACDLQQHRQLGPVNGLSTYTQQRW